MSFDVINFRQALGHFATGVTVVTTRTALGHFLGFTANSFNSVSLDPPLVLFSLNRQSSSLDAFEQSGSFAINVLEAGQREASLLFASAEGKKNWQGMETETWETGSPIFRNALARFDCQTHAIYDGGDHRIFLGRVLRFDANREGCPLIFFRGGYSEVK